jgi:hypothetical protein
MKAYGGVDVQIHIFLASALIGGEWSASCPYRFTPGEKAPSTYWIGGWVDPRVGLDDVENRKFLTLPGRELRSLGRPARSQSLYRLRYPMTRISGPKRMNLIGGLRNQHKREQIKFQSSSNIMRTKSRKMRWAGQGITWKTQTCMGGQY